MKTTPFKIAPILILSTGRCGSTMVSEMLSLHPGILSVSEFFMVLGPQAFAWRNPSGERMWRLYSRQSAALHSMLKDGEVVDENLYPLGQPGSRYEAGNLPPILSVTLPHLSPTPDALFDELAPVIRSRPRAPLAEQYRFLFEYLGNKFGRKVWVERSGGSLMHAAKLLAQFPDARVVHVYRDGRDTAMSMSNHHHFRVLIAAMRQGKVDRRKLFLETRKSPWKCWVHEMIFRLLDVRRMTDRARLGLADFGKLWSDMVVIGDEVLSKLPSDRLLNLKFEDLQSSPREKLRELIRFVDPSLDDEGWLDAASAIPKPARSKFLTLPEEDRAALTRACEPGLKLLGYPL